MAYTQKPLDDFPLLSAEDSAVGEQMLYNQVFFSKLAEYGVVPQNEQEAVSALQMAISLRSVKEAQAATTSVLTEASDALTGVINPQSQASMQAAEKAASDHQALSAIVSDPTLYQLLLSGAVHSHAGAAE